MNFAELKQKQNQRKSGTASGIFGSSPEKFLENFPQLTPSEARGVPPAPGTP